MTWIALTLLLMWQALRGQPVTAPDGLTVVVLVGIVGVALLLMAVVTQRAANDAARPLPVVMGA